MKKNKILTYLILIIIIILIIFSFTKIFNKKEKNNNTEESTSSTTTTTTTTITNSTTTTTKSTTTSTSKTTTTTKKADPTKLTGTSSKGYAIEYKEGAYYVGGYLIANKTYLLAKDWEPKNTYKKITPSMDGFCRECIDKEAYKAWSEMRSDASALGLNLWIQSGYRGYYYQQDLYNGYVKRKGKEAADKSSARPGASEHQTGLAFDLNTITNSFKDTKEGKWINNNCYLYGYIIRYPEGKTNETGYIYEPWHIRYVGKELAKKLYNDGAWLTMEDYFGITSKYTN